MSVCAEEKVCVWPKKSEIVCGFKCVCVRVCALSNKLVMWFRKSKYGRLLYACCRFCVAGTIFSTDSVLTIQ